MTRIKLTPPEYVDLTVELDIRVTDLNYGAHLGNVELLGMLHEARVKYLAHYGNTELGDANTPGIILNDVAMTFHSEGFLGERLSIAMTAAEPWRAGYVLYYVVHAIQAGVAPRLVATARTGIAFFDYDSRKLQNMPKAWSDRLNIDRTETT
ncbi:acyl-CoA thioesterase [Silvimonas amylolytica]|uniref:Acyl-CoA thioesterase FadM n=1 Tax=Silvimonas amylolytica TaxID=449663 RepID=A0ABQ2PQL3_9NEIS|nr:thioesterase family protein [Silvimonas amylolytica]GGP27471.1 hypothetical protein GCM10010971_32900 [Silvimonas amylolytica]